MTYSEIKNKINAYTEVGFTTTEAFSFFRDSLRETRKKSGHKLAEMIGSKAQREGLVEGYKMEKYLH
jgi:hypothetical protein